MGSPLTQHLQLIPGCVWQAKCSSSSSHDVYRCSRARLSGSRPRVGMAEAQGCSRGRRAHAKLVGAACVGASGHAGVGQVARGWANLGSGSRKGRWVGTVLRRAGDGPGRGPGEAACGPRWVSKGWDAAGACLGGLGWAGRRKSAGSRDASDSGGARSAHDTRRRGGEARRVAHPRTGWIARWVGCDHVPASSILVCQARSLSQLE